MVFKKIKGRRFAALAALSLALWMLLSAFAPGAHAEGERGSISIVKTWDAQGMPLPQSVTLHLESEGEKAASIVLTAANAAADGNWLGSFENVPLYDDSGRPVEYTVSEETPEGYNFSVTQQPRARSIEISRWGKKITPASSRSYSIGGSNFLVANKGGDYYIWTRESLDAGTRLRLLSLINEAGLQGFGKELKLGNTEFRAGLPAAFDGGITVNKSRSDIIVEFEKTNVWSLFYPGSYEIIPAKSAVVKNTAQNPQPTPEITPQPSPLPTPTPAPQPDTPPKTADTASTGPWSAMLMAALTALTMLLRKLKGA